MFSLQKIGEDEGKIESAWREGERRGGGSLNNVYMCTLM
jgi:hypothetical protein